MHAFQVSLERATRVNLAREVSAIGDPNRKRLRAENSAYLDALDVVFDSLQSHARIGMSETTEVVRQFLTTLVLKRIRIHRIEVESALAGESSQLGRVFRLVQRVWE